MDRTGIERVLDMLASQPAGRLPVRLCAAATDALSVSGAGIAMVSDDAHFQSIGATGSGVIGEELQLTLGEGPSYDAYRHGQPVVVDDVAAERRWLMLGHDAVKAGIGAIFAFPLRSGAAQLGAFTLYRDRSGQLDDEQYRDALVFARVILHLLVAVQDDRPSGDLHEVFSGDGAANWEIPQATGMVAAQLGISINDALARLRGHAMAAETTLGIAASMVVAGTLLFSDD